MRIKCIVLSLCAWMHFGAYFGFGNKKYPKLATYHLGIGSAISQLNAQLWLCVFPCIKSAPLLPRAHHRSTSKTRPASDQLFASLKAFVTFPFFLDSDRAFLWAVIRSAGGCHARVSGDSPSSDANYCFSRQAMRGAILKKRHHEEAIFCLTFFLAER